MAQANILKCRGLYTFQNNLSEIPEGSLVEADNIVIDREGVIGPRRGFALYGSAIGSSTANRAKQLFTYKNRVFRHWGVQIDYDSDGAGNFASIASGVSEIEDDGLPLRIKTLEANGNLFITTSSGIKKISAADSAGLASATLTDAGGIKALDLSYELVDNPGFLTSESAVAYRVVWGIKDANGNLILGAPSEFVTVYNSLLDSLLVDFSTLCSSLNTAAAASGSDKLSDVDYNSLTSGVSSAPSLHSALKGLCAKLDNDLEVAKYRGKFGTITTISAATTTTITTSSAHGLTVGSTFKVIISDSNSTPSIDGTYTATVTGVSTFTIPTKVDTAGSAGQWQQTSIYTSYSTAPDMSATTGMLYDLQDFYNEIVDTLLVEPVDKISASAQTAGNFQNATENCQVELTFTIPDGVTANHFYQIYRSAVKTNSEVSVLADLTVLDELQLAYEGNPDPIAELPAKKITITDKTFDSFLGANLYTNINSGEGISQQNDAPPVAKDIALFKGSVFYANTRTRQQKEVNLISALSLSGKKFYVKRGTTTLDFTFGAVENFATRVVPVSTATTPAQQVDETARALVRNINRQSSCPVYAYYISGAKDVPGAILLEDRQLGESSFSVYISDAAIKDNFSPALPTVAGQEVSDNEVRPNRVYYSKYQQPEAVPALNFFDIGPKDKKIIRILALRDSLFVIKEDGVYKITGEFGQFQVTLFDSSSKCIAPDTAVVLNNQIYMFSNQGIATISDTGVSVISRPIENRLLELTSHEYINFASASFAIPYESDRAYLVWTVKNSSDEVASQCFRYNTFTNAWTHWGISKTCGVVSSEDDRIYLGASDLPYVERERKNFTRLDHADREYSFSLPVGAISGSELSLGGLYGMEVGDVIVQTQYVSVAQFNRLLKKLDQDSGLVYSDYYSSLKAGPGSNVFELFTLLVAKLNADPGTTETYIASGTTDPQTLQTEFNAVINALNSDDTVSFTNYVLCVGVVEWETAVTAIDTYTKKITLSFEAPLITGDCAFYKHIKSSVTWAPQHFGDPSITKQVRETTLIFQNNSFVEAKASYASDLSTGFVAVPFYGEGTGTWGGFEYGGATWGGEGTSKPLRTYVPREKQRCRYITAKFDHAVAFENYSILGLSFTFESVSSRGYR